MTNSYICLVFLYFCLWSLLAKTEIATFRKDPCMNVKGHGKTQLLAFLIENRQYGSDGKKPMIKILQTDEFVHVVIEPICLILLGFNFLLTSWLFGNQSVFDPGIHLLHF
ncbi:MAG: hypothetical protein IPL46_18420 [Saprospiraceae bacterium]|nr:hypothetical protein [Saprospiraceae bacterium]